LYFLNLLLKFKTLFDAKLFLELKLIPHREQTLSQLYGLITIKYQNALHVKYITFVWF